MVASWAGVDGELDVVAAAAVAVVEVDMLVLDVRFEQPLELMYMHPPSLPLLTFGWLSVVLCYNQLILAICLSNMHLCLTFLMLFMNA